MGMLIYWGKWGDGTLLGLVCALLIRLLLISKKQLGLNTFLGSTLDTISINVFTT